jgi:hydrogenase maturation factor
MCLTIPKKVVKINGNSVVVETYGGDRQTLKTLIELAIGDFVLSQQNIVIEKIDKHYAKEIFKIIKQGMRE